MTPTPVCTEYTVGLLFDTDGNVALIRRDRPAWQAGALDRIDAHS